MDLANTGQALTTDGAIVDSDIVCVTNVNRQVQATSLNLGKPKASELRRRLLEINPGAEIRAHDAAFTPETEDSFGIEGYDYVVDDGLSGIELDLDELPQFWNVLKGDMSIVGPRPERPFFVEQFKHRIPQYMLRHKVKAGITGWAQVHGWRGNTSIRKRLEYDLYYIENWTLALDFKILWMTLRHGLRHNAH